MVLFVEQTLNGIAFGVVYASIAIALVLIFRVTRFINFAQGEMALFSTYISWWLASEQGLNVVLAIAISTVLGFFGGALIERVIIRPVEGSPNPLSVVIVTLGMFLALNALVQLIFGTDQQRLESPFPSGSVRLFSSGNTTADVSYSTLGLFAVLMVECLALWLLLERTRLGLKLRAVAANPESSRLLGIDTGRMLMVGWGLAAMIGALSGSLLASTRTGLDAGLMQEVLVYAFAAAALGGFDSLVGAVVGGIVVGITQTLTTQYLDPVEGMEVVVPLVLILVVLMVRPQGLFGKRAVVRV